MNKLAKYIIAVAVLAIIVFIVWYFRSVITYILVAALLSLMGRPLVRFLSGIRIKKYHIPKTVSAILVMGLMFGVLFLIFYFITPMVVSIVSRLDSVGFEDVPAMLSGFLAQLNEQIHTLFPSITPSVSIESLIWNEIDKFLHPEFFTRLFGSLASFFVNFGVGLFSVAFITFFFLREENMFSNMLMAIVPVKYEEKFSNAMKSVNELLLRYFIGILVEFFIMTIIISAGLHFITRIEYQLALVLGLIFGILNIVPYAGPLIGGTIGTIVAVVTSYATSGYSSLSLYVIALVSIYVGFNMLDTYLIQPLIYSSSIKAHPLEIFLVILLSGYIGGAVGMLVAIPAYTVLRVFASEFLSRFKVVQKLTAKSPDHGT